MTFKQQYIATREQYHQKQAQKLIDLANDVLAESNGTPRLFDYSDPYFNPMFKRIKKLERKFRKRHKDGINIDVGEKLENFSIELQYIPERLHYLMALIGWINTDTYAPNKHQKGFYSNSYHDSTAKDASTKIWYYITVDRYIDLLFIDSELQYRYNPSKIAA